MYASFFGLHEKPFAITPDPRYLYLSERHAEALAHLLYGINQAGGFIQLTGVVGTGKTTVLRSLLQQLPPHCDVALILNPRVTPAEFLLAICDELHVQVPAESAGSVKVLVDLLTHFLLDAHGRSRRIVLMVDEAQNLDADVLEQVRLLTNLETATQKLLQIILIGQPELRDDRRRCIRVLSSAQRTEMVYADASNFDAEMTRQTTALALADAGISPVDLDIVELHDAFSVEEIFYLEAMGIANAGEAPAMLRAGAFDIGGDVPVSPSGGLLAMGHPIGPTGAGQIVEITRQLRGEAGVFDREQDGDREAVVE